MIFFSNDKASSWSQEIKQGIIQVSPFSQALCLSHQLQLLEETLSSSSRVQWWTYFILTHCLPAHKAQTNQAFSSIKSSFTFSHIIIWPAMLIKESLLCLHYIFHIIFTSEYLWMIVIGCVCQYHHDFPNVKVSWI